MANTSADSPHWTSSVSSTAARRTGSSGLSASSARADSITAGNGSIPIISRVLAFNTMTPSTTGMRTCSPYGVGVLVASGSSKFGARVLGQKPSKPRDNHHVVRWGGSVIKGARGVSPGVSAGTSPSELASAGTGHRIVSPSANSASIVPSMRKTRVRLSDSTVAAS